ncbi:metallophosphoesterase family protein [Mesorhizobium sp. YIM 152430]|uniref:metallophosphoesterase family protein n=1 Tax=Mesorhizobium sp. YIM 152430 TaxID=3031761 RepID=UPI0023D9BE24|nr:metallophosphoesterase family protein [Mesorhizobium sp. YIM 152430]MDF1600203.1 metallophosphoesterase family protein [Mesorhizobium sp. YIM 152430]
MNTLGIISDTHGLLREEAIRLLYGVDHIIHAGDIGEPNILQRLAAIAPVSAIRGNIEVQPWASSLPDTIQTTLFGQKIYVIHDRNELAIAPAEMGIDLVISGHSHRASVEKLNDVLYVNPGSAGPRRFRLPITLATIEIAGGQLSPNIRELL